MAKRTDLPLRGAVPDDDAPRPGTRAWLLLDGRFGRVVAVGMGGLTCRVRLERSGTIVERPACELLRLPDDDEDG